MINYLKMDKMEQELSDIHSLEALKYLIEIGRELESELNRHICFISKYETSENVSLWIDKKEQSFSSMEEPFDKANIDGIKFLEIWDKADLKTLF